MFGRARGHTVREVSGFIDVSHQTVQRVDKHWSNIPGHEAGSQVCGWQKILSERYQRLVSWFVDQNLFQT